MKEVSSLLTYKESTRVLDATMRDGGLVNNFMFEDSFVKALYKANIAAGVDYMEVGYRASKRLFNPSDFGKWKFSEDEEIVKVLEPDAESKLKLSVMADTGRTDKSDIQEKASSPIDTIRVACYLNQVASAIELIEDIKKKGYEVTCNIMAISTNQESDLKVGLEMLGKSSVDIIYIVDSFGSIYPEEMARIVNIYQEVAVKYGKKLGVHAHNNQQLAFANTVEAVGDGVDYLDATYGGMGRGAGNASMENLIGFMKNPKYSIYPVLYFVENYIIPLKKKGVVWGYDLQYLITGLLNQHPRTAIAFTKEGRTDYCAYYNELVGQE